MNLFDDIIKNSHFRFITSVSYGRVCSRSSRNCKIWHTYNYYWHI